jgi:hypothetical protein
VICPSGRIASSLLPLWEKVAICPARIDW